MTFKVGDRVRVIREMIGCGDGGFLKSEFTLQQKVSDGSEDWYVLENNKPWAESQLTKIGGSMSKYEEGDWIKITKLMGNKDNLMGGGWYKVDKTGSYRKSIGCNAWWNPEHKGEGRIIAMNKYEDLKERIEDNRKNELGWGKEFDDILQEIGEYKKEWTGICMKTFTGFKNLMAISDSTGRSIKDFYYTNQCEKNTALHDAALWLLDHSDIKKEDRNSSIRTRIEVMEFDLKELRRELT